MIVIWQSSNRYKNAITKLSYDKTGLIDNVAVYRTP